MLCGPGRNFAIACLALRMCNAFHKTRSNIAVSAWLMMEDFSCSNIVAVSAWLMVEDFCALVISVGYPNLF